MKNKLERDDLAFSGLADYGVHYGFSMFAELISHGDAATDNGYFWGEAKKVRGIRECSMPDDAIGKFLFDENHLGEVAFAGSVCVLAGRKLTRHDPDMGIMKVDHIATSPEKTVRAIEYRREHEDWGFDGADFSSNQGHDQWMLGAGHNFGRLKGTCFKGAILVGACFLGADLEDADFRGANVAFADFRGANVSGADFRGANKEHADFGIWSP